MLSFRPVRESTMPVSIPSVPSSRRMLRSPWWGCLISALVVPLGAASAGELQNPHLRVQLSDQGAITAIENRAAEETYDVDRDCWTIDTDAGTFSSRDAKPARTAGDGRRVEFLYDFPQVGGGRPAVAVRLVYTLGDEDVFFRRHLVVSNHVPLRLEKIVLGDTVLTTAAREAVHYVTSIAAPTVEFLRHERGGLFTGIENPFFSADLRREGVTLAFEPGLILRAGEGYASEPQFLGVYRKSGVMVEDSGRPFRYDANGSGYKPLDRNETRAMRRYALDYLRPAQDRFLNINYQFFHPLPQMPRSPQDLDYFVKTIDAFSEIGGDMIIFRPLHPYSKPDAVRPFWNLLPDEPAQASCQVVDHARAKGITYGFYMGCAAHGQEGNAGGLSFRSDKPEWKKTDAAGRRGPDNCLACDDYYAWWFDVHDTTIRKYGLANWSWDPSLGSGFNCHDESHGHAAGQGGYKGWRRCIELMGRLKASNPGLFIQGFYGTKNFGLWGLKHVDQHEVYNEQTIIVSTRHHQISDDRQNADGLRFQNNWSMRFRFTPAVTGHSLVHRIGEGVHDPELIKVWDYYGWKYSVMSSLAVAGSVMPTILPYETSLVPGYVDFYRKWMHWARDNFSYVNHTEPFGEQVQPGSIDGYARIKNGPDGGHGFVFLFNGNPRPAEIRFEVGDEINLQEAGDYEFVELYPAERGTRVTDEDGRSIFARGDTARIVVPANECFLLELRRTKPEPWPVLLGAEGEVQRKANEVFVTGIAGRPGRRLPLRVRLADAAGVTRVVVNGVPQRFATDGGEIAIDLQMAGEPFIRELDAWKRDDGEPFTFPNAEPLRGLAISTTFRVRAELPRLLAAARPANFDAMAARIAGWQVKDKNPSFNDPYSYHNFVGSRPDRLWLVLPFLAGVNVTATINGRPIDRLLRDAPSNSWFADVTDLVVVGGDNRLELAVAELPPNAFLGPFLLYPSEPLTSDVSPEPASAFARVVFTRPLVRPPSGRYREGEGPRVVEARMQGNVTLAKPAALQVKLDRPPAQIRRVMFFESGFGWMGQHELRYEASTGSWVGQVTPGSRAAIQEHDVVYVWAEGHDGVRGEYTPVRVGWDFTTE